MFYNWLKKKSKYQQTEKKQTYYYYNKLSALAIIRQV